MAQMIERNGYKVWMDQKIGNVEYWSYERTDGTACGGNFRSQEAAEDRAKASLAERPSKTVTVRRIDGALISATLR